MTTRLEYPSAQRRGMSFHATYLILTLCTGLPALLVSAVAVIWVARYNAFFNQFGGSLPLPTRIVQALAGFPQNIALILGVVCFCALAPLLPVHRMRRQKAAGKRSRSGWFYIAAILVVTLLTIAFLVYAAIVPVFHLQELIR